MKRAIYIFLFVLIFVQEVIIAMYVDDAFIRPYGGDIIVEWLIYCFIRIFYPKRFKMLPMYIFLFSVGNRDHSVFQTGGGDRSFRQQYSLCRDGDILRMGRHYLLCYWMCEHSFGSGNMEDEAKEGIGVKM